MDEGFLIAGHIDALIQQLKWAEAMLLNADIESRIKGAATSGFAVLFERRRVELTKMRVDVVQEGASVNAWKQLYSKGRLCSELFSEELGFLGSALVRGQQAGVDDICEVADAFLYELNRKLPRTIGWGGVTLLAEGNFYTETTGLIRLPFPDYGIWNLPISAHELGHFVGPRITDGIGGFPFQILLQEREREHLAKKLPAEESAKQLSRQVSHLKELLSDLFGVYTLGPAYACSCILLRFNPADVAACKDSDTHPSHAKRVFFILEALGQMSEPESGQPYGRIKARLESLWATILKTAGNGDCLEMNDQPLSHLLFELYTIINKHLSSGRWGGWKRANKLRHVFLSEAKAANLLAPDHTIADVLNAAWLWRLGLDEESPQLVHKGHRRAVEMCREIMLRSEQDTREVSNH
ncbi:MAG TPA: hypothetical protein VK582_12190 [Pyrinomonadaceae bacterium]|nr:hypothetical protein [Pyrinomonadaceae bacterium]